MRLSAEKLPLALFVVVFCLSSSSMTTSWAAVEKDNAAVPTSAPRPVSTHVPTPYVPPCVKQVEVHKAIMSRTLLTVGMLSFFLGVCLCSAVVCCLWCVSAKVSYSVEDGVTSEFDGSLVRQHLAQFRDFANRKRQPRYERVATDDDVELTRRRADSFSGGLTSKIKTLTSIARGTKRRVDDDDPNRRRRRTPQKAAQEKQRGRAGRGRHNDAPSSSSPSERRRPPDEGAPVDDEFVFHNHRADGDDDNDDVIAV